MVSERNAKMGGGAIRAREDTSTHVCRHENEDAYCIYVCHWPKEPTQLGHLKGDYINEDVGFWWNSISLHIQILTFPQINNIGITFE